MQIYSCIVSCSYIKVLYFFDFMEIGPKFLRVENRIVSIVSDSYECQGT